MLRTTTIAIAIATMTACAPEAESSGMDQDAAMEMNGMNLDGSIGAAEMPEGDPPASMSACQGAWVDLSFPAERSVDAVTIRMVDWDGQPVMQVEIEDIQHEPTAAGGDIAEMIRDAADIQTVTVFAPMCGEAAELQAQAWDAAGDAMAEPETSPVSPRAAGDIELTMDMFQDELDCEMAMCEGPEMD